MAETNINLPELKNLVTIFADKFKSNPFVGYLYSWENIIFSCILICTISLVAYFAVRKSRLVPAGLQNIAEIVAGGIDDFICGILGPKGRKYTPFIGTLFIYIICMNLFGIIPLMKSPTTSWSTTLALALCVFIYVQYSGIKEHGIRGYIDHLMGKPRGFLAFSVIIPVLMFFLHVIAELVRPISLSLRLRSNIWGDDIILAIMTGFGLKGVPMLFFNTLLVILAGVVQAMVFCILTTIYFALVVTEE